MVGRARHISLILVGFLRSGAVPGRFSYESLGYAWRSQIFTGQIVCACHEFAEEGFLDASEDRFTIKKV